MGITKERKKMPFHIKIYIALFLGIFAGYILNIMGGTENPVINNHI